jgi:hypothetical protein
MGELSRFSKSLKKPSQWIISGIILLFLAIVVLFPKVDPRPRGPLALGEAHAINLAMFAYAQDHNGAYPTGKSSTEVFQKLLDGGYVFDTSLFYCAILKIPGKIPATSKILKPENVCWDVTADLNTNSPDEVPVVFSTGYKIDYTPGGKAVPRLLGISERFSGIVVSYHSAATMFARNDGLSHGIVINFISPTFVSGGKTYQQLTPDGLLSP